MEQSPPTPLNNLLGISSRDVERFISKINRNGPNGCWIWNGGKNEGYGVFWLSDREPFRAHRFCYEMSVGPIPEGHHLHHLVREKNCVGPACVNPDHLEPTTPENHARNLSVGSVGYIAARQTHCIRGHEFTPESVQVRKDGKKQCKICANQIRRDKYEPHPKVEKRECSKGHPLSGNNLVIYKTSGGKIGRGCRACRYAAVEKHRSANWEEVNRRKREYNRRKRDERAAAV